MLIFTILILIGVSRIDNKLGKTIYWKILVGSVLGAMLLPILLSMILHPNPFIADWRFIIVSLSLNICIAIIWFSILAILFKASCLEKKYLYIGGFLIVGWLIFNTYFKYYLLNNMFKISNGLSLELEQLKNISLVLLTLVAAIFAYVSYFFIKRLGYSKGESILYTLFLPFFLIYMGFSKKSLDNYTDCNGKNNNGN